MQLLHYSFFYLQIVHPIEGLSSTQRRGLLGEIVVLLLLYLLLLFFLFPFPFSLFSFLLFPLIIRNGMIDIG